SALEDRIIQVERRHFVTGEDALSSFHHTAGANKAIWENYDWSRAGEEWTEQATQFRGAGSDNWKELLIKRTVSKYMRSPAVILEIGPGAGRWTEILQPMASRLVIADISAKCLTICKERFGRCTNIDYRLIDHEGLSFLGNGIVDYVWS